MSDESIDVCAFEFIARFQSRRAFENEPDFLGQLELSILVFHFERCCAKNASRVSGLDQWLRIVPTREIPVALKRDRLWFMILSDQIQRSVKRDEFHNPSQQGRDLLIG